MGKSKFSFDALFTMDQVQERERADDFGVNRRIMLATLTRSSAQLIDGFRGDDGAGASSMLKAIGGYKDYLKALLEMTECAENRILATCHVLIEEAEQLANCPDASDAVTEVRHD